MRPGRPSRPRREARLVPPASTSQLQPYPDDALKPRVSRIIAGRSAPVEPDPPAPTIQQRPARPFVERVIYMKEIIRDRRRGIRTETQKKRSESEAAPHPHQADAVEFSLLTGIVCR